jgi:hypothetical protein
MDMALTLKVGSSWISVRDCCFNSTTKTRLRALSVAQLIVVSMGDCTLEQTSTEVAMTLYTMIR